MKYRILKKEGRYKIQKKEWDIYWFAWKNLADYGRHGISWYTFEPSGEHYFDSLEAAQLYIVNLKDKPVQQKEKVKRWQVVSDEEAALNKIKQ